MAFPEGRTEDYWSGDTLITKEGKLFRFKGIKPEDKDKIATGVRRLSSRY